MSALQPTARRRPAEFVTSVVVAMTEAWIRVYTAGLPVTSRDARRAELASDLFEHRRAALVAARPFAGELALRWLLGIPADLAWRVENARLAGQLLGLLLAVVSRLVNSLRWTVNRGLPGVTVGLAGIYLLFGGILFATLGFEGNQPQGERAWAAIFLVGSSIAIIGGLRLAVRHRAWGMLLLLLGAVPLALALSSSVIVPLASGAAVLTGVVRFVKRPERAGRII